MSSIILQSNYVPEGTFVPNIFIDKYMPLANGAYVKVYLYLLRCINQNNGRELVISSIADYLDHTERDIIKALFYWEKVHLITLITDQNNQISSIILNDIHSTKEDTEFMDRELTAARNYEEEAVEDPESKDYESKDKKYQDHKFDKPTYSDAQIEQLTQSDEVKWMLNIIELYLQRLIKPMDLQLILYLYESLDFSTELILYLYEYCVSKNKTSPSYIETVALSWAEEGIDTLEKAEESTSIHNSNYNAIKKAFGLNRSPGHIEKEYINKWIHQYQLPIEIIVEACNRAILRTQKPDFKYTDKILENWYKKGATTLEQIAFLDEEHARSSAKSKVSNYSKGQKPSSGNRFNAFPQRTYTKEDYSSIEQKLLNKR